MTRVLVSTDDSLPKDLGSALRIIAIEQQTIAEQNERLRATSEQNAQLILALEQQKQKIQWLERELQKLAKQMFGKSSEKLDPHQLQLALDLIAAGIDTSDEGPIEPDSGETVVPEPKPRKKGKGGRRKLPAHLPRQRVVLEPPAEALHCGACNVDKACIGESVSEKVEYSPAMYHVVQTVVPRYSCPRCHEGVVQAEVPAQAVEKGIAGEGLLAHVVVSKYADHLPLHRQEGIFERQGLPFARSTLAGFVKYSAEALAPIVLEMKRQVLASDYLQTDDTPVLVLEPDDGGSIKGRVWTYLSPLGRQVVFTASRTHERRHVEDFLGDYRGFMQADAYNGYDAVYRSGRIIEVACWAHARRRFVTALDAGDQRAAAILALVQKLYAVEREAKDLAPDERSARRRERSLPVLAEIDRERKRLGPEATPKSPIGDALRYLDNQWTALQRYVHDGRLKIDNNAAESQLRAVAVGRKNWLFAGSFAGAERAAVLYSLVQSCKLAGVDPFPYLKDVLLRVATHPQSRIAELTPRAWAQAHALPTVATEPLPPTP